MLSSSKYGRALSSTRGENIYTFKHQAESYTVVQLRQIYEKAQTVHMSVSLRASWTPNRARRARLQTVEYEMFLFSSVVVP